MKQTLIDTHSHINFNAYQNDADEVIKRALDEDIQMIAVGSQISTSRRAVEYANKYDGVWAVVGLHPIHLQDIEVDEHEVQFKSKKEEFNYDEYKKLAEDKKVVAIGECGLDYYRINDIPADNDFIRNQQKEVFKKQLRLAQDLNLAVAIHCRDAYEDLIKLIKDFISEGNKTPRAVTHCFLGDMDIANALLDFGFYIAFTGIITFPKTEYLTRVVREIPLERILTETDCPYLTPAPHRGKRNEPSYVKHIAEKIAEIKNLSFEEVVRTTTQNAKKLFKI